MSEIRYRHSSDGVDGSFMLRVLGKFDIRREFICSRQTPISILFLVNLLLLMLKRITQYLTTQGSRRYWAF